MDTRDALKDALERRAYCWNDGEHEALPEIDAEIATLRACRDAEWDSLERLREQVAGAMSKAFHIESEFNQLDGEDDDRAERVTLALCEAYELLREMLGDRPA